MITFDELVPEGSILIGLTNVEGNGAEVFEWTLLGRLGLGGFGECNGRSYRLASDALIGQCHSFLVLQQFQELAAFNGFEFAIGTHPSEQLAQCAGEFGPRQALESINDLKDELLLFL